MQDMYLFTAIIFFTIRRKKTQIKQIFKLRTIRL